MVDGAVDESLRKKFFKRWRTRIRGGFNHERHKQLVAEIRDDIEDLCHLTKGTIDLEIVDRKQACSASSKYWLALRSHTHRVHDALRAMWSQSCSMHTHQANIRLGMPNGDEIDYEIP